MKPSAPSQTKVLDTLHRAAGVHARQRAALFLLRSLMWLALALPLMLLTDVLFHFTETPRLAGGIGWLLALVACGVTAMAMAAFAKPPLLRIARLLESRNPELGSKLVNILQLDGDARSESAAPLTRELARRAIEDAEKALDLPALPPLARESNLRLRGFKTLAAVCVVALLPFAGGPAMRQQWLRLLDPYGDHPPFSFTRIEILQPEIDHKVLYGGSQVVEVRASGHQPKELFLTARPLDASAAPVTLPLAPRGDGTFATRLQDIRSDLELTAHKADGSARSRHRTLGVILTPQIGASVARLEAPAYTGQPPREGPYRFTALQALEGSKVTFLIASNRPLGEGTLTFESEGHNPENLPLTPGAEGPPNTAMATLEATRSGRFTFHLVDMAGHPAKETPTASITVTRDQAPAVAITKPEQDAMVVEGLTIPVVVDATDDYGLHSLRLHVGINDTFLPLDPVTFDKPDTRRHRLEHKLDLKAAGAKAGDRIVVFAEAVDTRPDPQITRTSTRRLQVITEDQYNDHLREQTDVAEIAGKYERLLEKFEKQIEEQRRIERKLAELREQAAKGADPKELLSEFAEAYADQKHLNEELEGTAGKMEDLVRDKPVYDFEKDLQQRLREQAAKIRESAKQQQAQADQALEKGPAPPNAPNDPMIEGMRQAARGQLDRLEGGAKESEKQVREPLQELADLHELMKDFKRFEQMAEAQRELTEQSKAYQDKPNLNAEDRLAMRELGARQRDLAHQLEDLTKKLRQDAKAAEEKFPEAAQSAGQLADQMQDAAMPGLAREAAQSMLDSKAADAHAQAGKLRDEMDKLMEDAAAPGRQGLAQAMDRALRAERGMKPGDSFRQMLLSNKFRGMPGEGGQAAGAGGLMASSATDGTPMLMGGETRMDGPIANSIAGRGDGAGQGKPGAPTAAIDRADHANVDESSSRRTSTPDSGTLLLEYENIADAYFRRLTTKP